MGSQVPLLAQISRAEDKYWHNRHQEPVEEQQRNRDDGLRPPLRLDEDDGGDEITDRDALQHAGDTNVREIVVRKAVEQQAKAEDDACALEDLFQKIGPVVAIGDTARKRE